MAGFWKTFASEAWRPRSGRTVRKVPGPGAAGGWTAPAARAGKAAAVLLPRGGPDGRVYRPRGRERHQLLRPVSGLPTLSEATASEVIAHACAGAQAVEQALGCAVGLLDSVSIRHGHRVSLFDNESRRAVQGWIPAESQQKVRSVLGRRVRAIGTVTRNRRGQVSRVAAEELEHLGDAARSRSRWGGALAFRRTLGG